MTPLAWAVGGFGLLVGLYCVMAVLRTIQSVRPLEPATPDGRASWPRVSVIVTARNEAERLEAALRERLADDYPAIEFIVVDDRSTDETSKIVDDIAASDPRVVALHLRELPEGWLGKVHAMHRGVEHATGDWLLFSDGDVHIAPGTLFSAVSFCERNGVDHLAAMPHVWSSGFGIDIAMSALLFILIVFGRAWRVPDPKSSVAIGGGNFNFVRREIFARIGGFEDVKLDVLDDVLLGQRIKASGGRQAVVRAVDRVGLRFYGSLREMAHALEKNGFALHAYSIARLCVFVVLMLGWAVGPYVVVVESSGACRAVAGVGAGLVVVAALVFARWGRRPLGAALLTPIGIGMVVWMSARASLLAVIRQEIVWRDTRYSLDALRRGSRFKHPF